MTAFELCRQRPDLELAPVLRIVKYLGLDSANLREAEVEKIVGLHADFREDPELIVGVEQIGERTGLDARTVTSLLHERRRDIPFLGTPNRPMVPRVSLQLLREAAATPAAAAVAGDTARPRSAGVASAPTESGAADRITALESEVQAALEQVRGLSRTLSNISRRVQQTRSVTTAGDGVALRRHRRSGGGRPDTIVEACRKVLADAEEPLKVADITERVLLHGVAIRAKNPNVTVSSILSSYEVFERVRRGYYTLAESVSSPSV